jgi:hypothetical protein
MTRLDFSLTFQTARGCTPAFSRHQMPELCKDFRPPGRKRAQGKPDARCTRGLVCWFVQRKRTRAYRSSGGNPAFPARWVTAYFVLSPVTGFLATVIPEKLGFSRNLAPAPGRQDHTTSPYALATLVSRSFHVHRISPRVRDDRDPPLVSRKFGRMCERAVGQQPPVAGTEPAPPKGDRACMRARDSSGVFLNPNSCKGFEPAPSKEGSG